MSELLDWRPARLCAARELTPDIRLLEIEPEGTWIPPTPGGHINVMVQIDGRPDTRSYSLVDLGDDGRYRIAVKLLPDSRGGSAYMWRLQPGARLTIAGPGNHFDLARGRPEYLLMAGGIGITPIFSMAKALAREGARFRVLYGFRGRSDAALADDLAAAVGDRLELFCEADGRRIDLGGEIARLSEAGELYVCGPIPMLDAVKRTWRASGRPEHQLRFETFGASGRFAAEAFTLRIPRLQLELQVPRNRSMLEALEEAGVEMIHDCRRGECGLCALDVIAADGVIDHRDVFFTEEEKALNRKLCTCVSRVVGGSVTIDTPDRAVPVTARA